MAISPNDEMVAAPSFDMDCIIRQPDARPAKSAPNITGLPAPLDFAVPSISLNWFLSLTSPILSNVNMSVLAPLFMSVKTLSNIAAGFVPNLSIKPIA